ncbi:hypothetical protein [Lyngbya aestuarii]|uniref:hypothetical protein n=1 Tax=Lyngbya aestuarii TaxID=118322 RepID=UPI00403D6669
MSTNYIGVNSTVSDQLGGYGDIYDPTTGHYYDFYQITNVAPGYELNISLNSNNFDTSLYIYNASTNEFVGYDDNGGGATNSQLSFTPVFGDQDSYYAIVTSAGPSSTGYYDISVY